MPLLCDGNISIHAAREGGDHCGFFFLIRQPISIHAAREGGDPQDRDRRCSVRISIHAAREGGDQHDLLSFLITFYFNPRRP